jgi:HEAT repeat protein
MLPGDRVLVAEQSGNRLAEWSLEGKLLRECQVENPKCFARKTDGISVINGDPFWALSELDDAGRRVSRTELVLPENLVIPGKDRRVDGARLLPNGHVQYLCHLKSDEGKHWTFEREHTGRPNQWIVEIDLASDKEYGSARLDGPSKWLQAADVYRDGHVLLVRGAEIVELSSLGNIARRWALPLASPTSALRLHTGNLLVAGKDEWNKGCVVEIDARGKLKWEIAADEGLHCPRGFLGLVSLGFTEYGCGDWDLDTLDERIRALTDPSSTIRRRSLLSLEKKGPGALRAVPALLDLFDDPDERRVSYWLPSVLAAIGPDTVKPLGSALSDPRPKVRAGAAHCFALFRKEAEEHIPQLITALKDQDWRVRRCAAGTLGAIGGPAKRAVPAFAELLKREENSKVVDASLFALANIGPDAHPALPELLRFLESEDKGHPLLVIRALERMGPSAKGAVPALAKALERASSEDKRTVTGIASALKSIGREARPALPALRDARRRVTDPVVRRQLDWCIKQLESSP